MWDERYSEQGYAYGTEPNDFVASVVDCLPRGRALCLAEGQGRNAVYLAGRGWDVVAVDASSVGMARAGELAAQRGVSIQTVVADLAEFAVAPEAWDLIVMTFCHLPPPLRAQVHSGAVQGLRPGGALVLEAFTPRQLEYRSGGPKTPERLFGEAEVRAELGGLRFEILRETQRELSEGKHHQGLAAVVQVLGFRGE